MQKKKLEGVHNLQFHFIFWCLGFFRIGLNWLALIGGLQSPIGPVWFVIAII